MLDPMLRGGQPLDSDFRSFAERRLCEDFRNVVVHIGEAAHAVNAAFRTRALTDGTNILFARGCYRPDTDVGRLILMHELVHIAQKRRGRRCGSARPPIHDGEFYEREADRIATQAMLGLRPDPVTPDGSRRLRGWGPEGHYYTVYLAARIAEMEESAAFATAFFCQLPDLVQELDAVETYKRLHDGSMNPLRTRDGNSIRYLPQPWENMLNPLYQKMVRVQTGLHCLTGGSVAVERKKRRDALVDKANGFKPGSLMLGLELHAFGDTFAHVNPLMPSTLCDREFGHGMFLHFPDMIGTRLDGYLDYFRSLIEIFCALGAGSRTPVEASNFADTIKGQGFRDKIEEFLRVFAAISADDPLFLVGGPLNAGLPWNSGVQKIYIDIIRNYAKKISGKELPKFAPETVEKLPDICSLWRTMKDDWSAEAPAEGVWKEIKDLKQLSNGIEGFLSRYGHDQDDRDLLIYRIKRKYAAEPVLPPVEPSACGCSLNAPSVHHLSDAELVDMGYPLGTPASDYGF